MIPGQANQKLRRNIPLPQLIITVHLLRTMKNIRHLFLCQILILAQIPNPLVHHPHHLTDSIPHNKMQYNYLPQNAVLTLYRVLQYNVGEVIPMNLHSRWVPMHVIWLSIFIFLGGCASTPISIPVESKEDSAPATVILDVEPISQYPLFPTGCESVAAVMALHHAGVLISVEDFIDFHLPCDDHFYSRSFKRYGPDPYSVFVGDPRTTASYGCMAPVIQAALISCLSKDKQVINTTGTSLHDLCHAHIDEGTPVIVWATMDMRAVGKGNKWYFEDGTLFTWPAGEHCLLLVGYSETEYYFNDPRYGKTVAYEKELSESRYASMGMQSLVVR